MKKKTLNNILSEKIIINKYLKKLSFAKKGTYSFENDAAYLDVSKYNKIIITTDSITENLDFFKNDNPKSIAYKIIMINLSDLSAMGVMPHAYSLNLFLPNYIDHQWLNIFSYELLKLQKKYNFYLIGGDLSKSNLLSISANFYGCTKKDKIVGQTSIDKNYDIWVSGNLGDSFVGLQILKNKIKIKNIKVKNYFLNKYYFPKPNLIGSKISKYTEAMKDISDGFLADLKKMLNNEYGAQINLDSFPLSVPLKKLIRHKIINIEELLNCGDNYELIIISNKKNDTKIMNFSKKNKIKISKVGTVTKNLKISFDSNKQLNIPRDFDHFM